MRKYMTFLAVLMVAGWAGAWAGAQSTFQRIAGPDVTVREIVGADSIENLFPGRGAVLREFGADSCLVADVRDGGRVFPMTAITFSSPRGAMGAHAFLRDGARSVRGDVLVSVEPTAEADARDALSLSKTLVRRVSIPFFGVDLYMPLPEDDRIRGSEMYFMGPEAFTAWFGAELARELSVGEAIEGVAGRYRLAGGGEATLVKIRFDGRTRTREALHTFVAGREGVPMVRPTGNREYYTLFTAGNAELYIAEYGDWLLCVPDAPRGGGARQFFEFVLRSM